MKKEYIATPEDIKENEGIDLEQYCNDSSFALVTIKKALNIAVTRICKLCDNIKNGELGVEEALDKEPVKVPIFKKLQCEIVYNLIFTAETSPTDGYIDDIISHELNIGKVNGIQKGIHKKD